MKAVARDIMQTEILTVSPNDTLLDAYRTFVESEISGAPVVDHRGTVVGVLSIRDILRGVEEENDSARDESFFFRDYASRATPDWISEQEDFQDRLARRTVTEVMTQKLITVAPDTKIQEVARVVRRNHIHRALVLDGEELVGLVSLFDLVKLLE